MKIVETKDNNYTAQINNQFIHSRFSPIKEATKYINNILKSPKTVIVLGAGLGYLYRVINESHPDINMISIPYNMELAEKSLELNSYPRDQWDGVTDLEIFIKEHITQQNLKGLQILEWEPVTKHYSDLNNRVHQLLVKRIRLLNGNIMTTRRFGKRWLNNSIRNYLNIDSYIDNFTINSPIIIIASGKSLENSIDLIRKVEKNVVIISLSSAGLALNYYGIKPDLVFSTDPGYYSKLHITGTEEILAMPLTNAKIGNSHILLLNQGNFFEEELIKSSNLPFTPLRENGTVAGTALEFALTYSQQKIYLFGQDLESSDIVSHVNPYAFDHLLQKESTRLNPYYSTMYKRYIDQGVSFKTYRDWFSQVGQLYPDRIKRVNSQSQNIKNIRDITSEQFLEDISKSISGDKFNFISKGSEPFEKRQEVVRKTLKRWINSIETTEIAENPLIPLIYTKDYTDDNSKTLSKIKEESKIYLKRMLIRYGRKLF